MLLVATFAAYKPYLRNKMLDNLNKTHSPFHETNQTLLNDASLELTTNLLDLIQVPMQTYLILVINNEQFNLNEIEGKCKHILKLSLQFLAMSNFMAWMDGSFLEFEIVQEIPWNDLIFGKKVWTGIAIFTLPVTLFYRFHSVHLMIEVYIESWSHQNEQENPGTIHNNVDT